MAILDADKEGFLRSETSLDSDHRPGGPQRERPGDSVRRQGHRFDAARHRRDTAPPRFAGSYNREHGITPETIRKSIKSGIESEASANAEANLAVGRSDEAEYITEEYIQELETEMLAAAESLEFERTASLPIAFLSLRDSVGKKRDEVEIHATRGNRGKRRGRGKGTGGRVPRPKRS